MRILLANSSAYPSIGGVENSLNYIGRELLNAGHEVKIFSLQNAPEMPPSIVHNDIEIIRALCTPKRWPHAGLLEKIRVIQSATPNLLKTFRPDAIWSRYAPAGLGLRRGGYKGPLLHIFSTNAKMNCLGAYLQTHGLPIKRRAILLGLFPFEYLFLAKIEQELLRQCKAIVFSENMGSQLLKSYSKVIRSCHVIPPGVDHEFFSPENGSRYFDKIEQRYGISRREPIVLYVGRLTNSKKIPMLMDAVALLDPAVRLVLVGDGPEKDNLIKYSKRIGINERLIFAGIHHEMLPGFYAMSRVYALPTTVESFGQVYLESLACGTPAVGFAGDGCAVLTATEEIIKDGKTGGIVKSVSAHDFADKINKILSLDDKGYTVMSQCSREDVLGRFSWQRFVSTALELST